MRQALTAIAALVACTAGLPAVAAWPDRPVTITSPRSRRRP